MRIKKGDTVVVLTGKDKGKKGKVTRVIPDKDRVVVEGVNMQTKHQKQTRTAPAEIKHQEGPIHVSNVMLVDNENNPTRVGVRMDGDKKVRYSKKSGNAID
ncbi:MAG: 50S ribosomal protein L24 [Eubacteriales bacterium]|nr:50S ribosomal protein L24 [Eubacteriales bacterium]